jgi:amino acid transporter
MEFVKRFIKRYSPWSKIILILIIISIIQVIFWFVTWALPLLILPAIIGILWIINISKEKKEPFLKKILESKEGKDKSIEERTEYGILEIE